MHFVAIEKSNFVILMVMFRSLTSTVLLSLLKGKNICIDVLICGQLSWVIWEAP